MPERIATTLTCPSCLAQLPTDGIGHDTTTITCSSCGDPCPVPAALRPPAPPPVPAANAPIFAPTVDPTLPPPDAQPDPASHVPPVLPIPAAYQPPAHSHATSRDTAPTNHPRPPVFPPLRQTPLDRGIAYVFHDVIGRNQVTAACYGVIILSIGALVVITLATIPKHTDIALAAGKTLLPIAAVLAILPGCLKPNQATNPEYIVIWAGLMIPILILLQYKDLYGAGLFPILVLSVLLMLKAVLWKPRID